MCTVVGHNKPVDWYFVAAPAADVIQLSLPRWMEDFLLPELLDLTGGWVSRVVERVVEDTGA